MSGKADSTAGPAQPVTRLLVELSQGSREALDALMPLVYDELTDLAHRHRLRWHGDHTLGTTALVHEAYLKLSQRDRVVAENRAHFFALASRAMRHILCNYARDRRAAKRGGAAEVIDLDRAGAVACEVTTSLEENDVRLLALHAALSRLEEIHPRRGRVVECRFFGGLTVEETAAALKVSARTVKRDWAAAQDWLRREIDDPSGPMREAGGTLGGMAADVLPSLLPALEQAIQGELQPGERVTHYEIVASLGRGGMGMVYRARDTRLDRDVALKFLPARLAGDAAARERLTYEARAASSLDHPNICTVYDIGTLEDGRTFLALACYDGVTLRQKIAGGPLSLDDVVDIARQVAAALAAAHRRGIVHRDINPSNIMVTPDGTVKILDFGIAMVRDRSGAMPGGTAGTIAYMSPEHTRGESLDGRADLWSLGVMIHEMLTGRRPFAAADDASLVHAIRTRPLSPLATGRDGVPPLLLRLVETCLRKERDARYRDADELLADLRAIELPAGARSAPGRRVAILPLTSSGADAEDVYLADSITDEMVARLSRIGGLHVIARASTVSALERSGDPTEIGGSLGVDRLVRGTVARVGGDMQVALEMVDVERANTVWTVEQRVPLARLESALRTLAWQVAGELAVQVYGEERRRLARQSTDSPAAYTLYLKGRYFWNKRDRSSMQQARGCFEQAIDLDPVFAQAWAGLADTFCVLGGYMLLQPEDAYPRARAAAERALALDDELPEAHASLATILADHYWDWPEAGRHYRRAIELNPSYATARLWYAGFLRDLGQFDEALAQVRTAGELDPLPISIRAAEGITLYLARRHAESVSVFRRLVEVSPSFRYVHFLMALPLVQQGAYPEALRSLEQAEQWTAAAADIRSVSGYIHGMMGNGRRARTMLEALDDPALQQHTTPFHRAVIHLALGDHGEALGLLERACAERVKQVRLLRTEPLLDPLRDNPRFLALLRRVGLSDPDVAQALATPRAWVSPTRPFSGTPAPRRPPTA
jgi:eukaryotic-like serine/threonine-protein kinase